jgi:hypothetical protein
MISFQYPFIQCKYYVAFSFSCKILDIQNNGWRVFSVFYSTERDTLTSKLGRLGQWKIFYGFKKKHKTWENNLQFSRWKYVTRLHFIKSQAPTN